jgi:hypothetical protein
MKIPPIRAHRRKINNARGRERRDIGITRWNKIYPKRCRPTSKGKRKRVKSEKRPIKTGVGDAAGKGGGFILAHVIYEVNRALVAPG